MNTSGDADGDAARDRFAGLLNEARARSIRIAFWWRDDDATTATPELDRLLALAAHHGVPIALAVIPKDATTELAERLADEPQVSVLQHGWQHQNHSPPDEKKMELGAHRPLSEMLEELSQGRARLEWLFPQRFLPVLVPPWNRIAAAVRETRGDARLIGFSAFGPAPPDEAHSVNTHLDIIDWRTRGPLPRAEAFVLLCREMERRLGGDPEPLGLLTHHLLHQEPSWAFLDELLETTTGHDAVTWPSVPALFALN